MFIYEIFRKTNETYICCQLCYLLNLEKKSFINLEILYFKHMLEIMFLNSKIFANLNSVGDILLDNHHLIEDLGIIIGKILKYFLPFSKKLKINRYGFSYVALDESLSRVVLDISGRSYLSYNVFYYNLYIKNFNLNLIYDFFLSFSNNSFITLYIDNLVGYNSHHIFESIFKSFGFSLRNALFLNENFSNSTKGIMF